MTPADLRSLIAAMREYPAAYAPNNDNLAAFAYGVLVGAGDDRVRAAWRAAVAHVFYPTNHGSMEPKWWKHPASRVVDVFEHAAFSLDLTTDTPNESPIVDLILRAQAEADPDRHCRALARRGYPLVADVAKRAREALDAANATPSAQTLAFDDPPPAVAHREALARARRMLDAGDAHGCIREMLTMMEWA